MTVVVGVAGLPSLFNVPPFGLPLVDKGRGSKSVEVQRVWEICDDRLQFMARDDSPLVEMMFLLLGLFGLGC